LYEKEGSFDDGSGTYYYYRDLDNKWVINPPPIYKITLTIDSLNTEENKDFLYIYDMQFTFPVLLKTLTGNRYNVVCSTNSNNIMLKFKTDNKNSCAGWKAHYNSEFMLEKNSELYRFTCFPNPTNEELNIYFDILQPTDATIEIVDLSGVQLYFEELKKYSGPYNKTFKENYFKKGVYIIKLITERSVIVDKFEKL
jgi:hypothetical protein